MVAAPRTPSPHGAVTGRLRIVCPTYWYPQHATDTQATYVHDINRHLVRRGHLVTVVTPGHPSQPRTDNFDGVEVVRFPMEIPADLTYGRVAQSQVNWLSRSPVWRSWPTISKRSTARPSPLPGSARRT